MADAALKALYVATHGTDDGWLGLQGSGFISGAQAAMRQAATPPAAPEPLSDERIDAAIRDDLNALLDVIYEYGTTSEAVRPAARKFARAILAGAQERT